MRTECSRNCWMAGGLAGLTVWLAVALVGEAGWVAGLFLGLLSAGLLGGLLVWGLCQGAGNPEDNEALLAGGWQDQPFTPIRRVVRSGGELVSQEPLAAADRIPGGAPLDSRTVVATRADGAGSGSGAPTPPASGDARPVEPRAGAEASAPRPVRIVAGASPDAPVQPQTASSGGGSEAGGGTGSVAEGGAQPDEDIRTAPPQDPAAETEDRALWQPISATSAQVAHQTRSPVEGFVLEEPVVRDSINEERALQSTGFVEPRTDSETGSDPRAPEGRIEPISPAAGSADIAGAEAGRKDKDANGKGRDDAEGHRGRKDRKKARHARDESAGGDGAAAAGERVMTVTGGEGDDEGDDLTRIRGIGPMLRTWLAGYGVTHFAQIAAWDDADIARFAGMMGRKGHRIRDEDWVGQARLLAAGGETAHSHPADTGEAD